MDIMDEEKIKKLFIEPSTEASEWEDKVFEASKTGDEKALEKLLLEAEELYPEECQINSAIENFTRKGTKEEREKLLYKLTDIKWVKSVKIENERIYIDTEQGPINVGLISNDMNGYENDLRLLTNGRKGFCHTDAIKMCRMYEKECFVVTGYIYGIADRAKYLHSWVEMNIGGIDFVADYTMNAYMNKDAYYFIKNAKELSRVSNKQIKEDWKILGQLSRSGITFMENEYLVFRDEYMKDLKKNFKKLEREDR